MKNGLNGRFRAQKEGSKDRGADQETELAAGHQGEGDGWSYGILSALEMLRGKGRAGVRFEILLKGDCFFAGFKGNR